MSGTADEALGRAEELLERLKATRDEFERLAAAEDAESAVEVLTELAELLIGKILKTNGAQVARDEEILTLNSDEQSIWEALRGLSLIGTPEDLPVIQTYATSTEVSTRIKDQAVLTAKAIESRKSV